MSDRPAAQTLPYFNLVLTGSVGSRLLATGQAVAKALDAACFSLDLTIHERAGGGADDLRKLYGEAYVRRVETEICREFALRRSVVLCVSPSVLLDEESRARLLDSGAALNLTCGVDEALRRVYIQLGARFHDPKARVSVVHALTRDRALLAVGSIATLNTTYLSIDQAAARAVQFWEAREPVL